MLELREDTMTKYDFFFYLKEKIDFIEFSFLKQNV